MIRRTLLVLLCMLAVSAPQALAAPPWSAIIPFRRVEVDPLNWYELTENNGPWLILAASFRGEQAMHQAHELVLELRKKHRLPAYLLARQFDFTAPEKGLGLTKDGQPKMMRNMHGEKFVEVAVMVGDFDAVDDPRAQRTLETIKHARPECLDLSRRRSTSQQLARLREVQRMLSPDKEMRQKGPMRAAFITSNPLLPPEFFAPKGLDPLVVSMNQGVPHSLLDCKGVYSVKVATFRGKSTMKLDEIEASDASLPSSKLLKAAEKAHRLTEALREQGIEAYEFHDLYESVVTVGSFSWVGQPRADGKEEINPAVHRVMQTYAAERKAIPRTNKAALVPRRLAGISFDVQPVPIKVPRASIASQYARREILR